MSLESNFNREWKPMCERQFDLGYAKGEEDGFVIGRDQGFAIGRDQGFAIGRDQGVNEEKLATATNMLYEGFDFEMINKITGLDLTIIQDLAKNLKKQ